MMTKADYDELVRLRDAGYAYVSIDWNGDKFAYSGIRETQIRREFFKRQIPRRGALNIAAAIAEYERAQEGK